MSLTSSQNRALLRGLQTEVQAIAIYEAECAVLAASAWSQGRRISLRACREILAEEREHLGWLSPYARTGLFFQLQSGVNRLAGHLLGVFLALLPAKLSWLAHAWAEIQAAEAYEITGRELGADVPLELKELLRRAAIQERGHSDRFRGLKLD